LCEATTDLNPALKITIITKQLSGGVLLEFLNIRKIPVSNEVKDAVKTKYGIS
jgi:hypothetical protein